MIQYTEAQLLAFVKESNKIENILRDPTPAELDATWQFLDLPEIHLVDLSGFVYILAGAHLRDKPNMDVQVGNHIPVKGGLGVRIALEEHLKTMRSGHYSPHWNYIRYETLHPYMDGNGRSGRALWARQMLHEDIRPGIEIGFLNAFHYQTLEESDLRIY